MVVARGWGQQGLGSNSLWGTGFYLGVMKMFWIYMEVGVSQYCGCTERELLTLQWLILCYVNFIVLLQLKKKCSLWLLIENCLKWGKSGSLDLVKLEKDKTCKGNKTVKKKICCKNE